MNVFHTPDDRFDSWRDYPFAPNYVVSDGDSGKLRMRHAAPSSKVYNAGR